MDENRGTLKVYVQDNDFVVERINPFNHSTKHKYISEDGLREGIEMYKSIADELDLLVQQGVTLKDGTALLWRVANTLFDENHVVTDRTKVNTFEKDDRNMNDKSLKETMKNLEENLLYQEKISKDLDQYFKDWNLKEK